ncbi:Ig-like domain-containing protein [Chloroflexota bacterium]
MKKFLIKLTHIMLALFLVGTFVAALPPQSVRAVGDLTDFDLIPASPVVSVNDTFTVTIQVQTGDYVLTGATAYIDYDETKLSVESWNDTGPDVVAIPVNNTVPGEIDFVEMYMAATPTGTFEIAQITFKALDDTASTLIGFSTGIPRVTASTNLTGFTTGVLTGADVTINPVLVSLAVTPPGPSIPLGTQLQFTAMGTYSNASTANLTATATWESLDEGVATVTDGLVTSVAEGTATIRATSGAFSGNTTLTVGPAEIASLVVTPPGPSIPLGTQQQFSAMSTYTDASTVNLTATATWESLDEGVATIVAGLATSVAEGTATIRATSGAFSGNTTLTVGPAELVSIVVTPPDTSIALGLQRQLTATGTYTDASTANITPTASWTSSDEGVATIVAGLATSIGVGTATINATSGAIIGSTTLTVGPHELLSIVVTPPDPSIDLGLQKQFTATGTYTDGTANITPTATWISSDEGVATVVAGLATSVAVGTTNITAEIGAISGNTTLTVGPHVLLSIAVTPEDPIIVLGSTQQFTATGTYTDGDSDVTGEALWDSSIGGVATIDPGTGLATSVAVGTTNITAEIGAISGNTSLEVRLALLEEIAITPPTASIALGLQKQFTATGTYDDASTGNISAVATWNSTDEGVATIVAGLATSVGVGTTTITVSHEGIDSPGATLTVTAADLVSIEVTPPDPSIALGLTQQFSANGTYTDGSTANITTSVTWTSSNPGVAIVSAAGVATSVAEGTTNITATSGVISEHTLLTVGPPQILSITVTPTTASIAKGLTQQFTASGTYTNGTVDVTNTAAWSSNSTVATVVNGLATGQNEGTATITATISAVSGSAYLTVTPPVLLSMAVTPSTQEISATETYQFTATGTYTDGSRVITSEASWSSSNPGVASIKTTGQINPGQATGHTPGTVTITATRLGISGTATLTVVAAEINTIAVYPANPTLIADNTLQFRAIGNYLDGSAVDITASANWSSSNTGVATIDAAGLAVGVAAGSATINATLNSKIGNTALTVLGAAVTLDTITVTPDPVTKAAGLTQQFTAMGEYSDTSTANLTRYVTWSSNSTAVASIITTSGLARGRTAGNATITAALGAVSGTAEFEVTAAVLSAVKVAPVNPTVALISGATQVIPFKATGINTDGSTTDITNTAAWGTSNGGVATVNATGHVEIQGVGWADISADTGISRITVLGDTVAPVVRLSSPMDRQVISSTNLTVAGNVDDVNATVTIKVNTDAPLGPVAVDPNTGDFSLLVTTLVAGKNSISVRADDVSLNRGSSGTRMVEVNPIKPEIKIITPVEGLLTNNRTLIVTGNVSGASSATVRLNGVAVATVGSGPFSTTVTLAEGKNNIVVSGYAGAYLGSSGMRTVRLDTTAPRVAIRGPASGSVVNRRGITIFGTVDDPRVYQASLTLNAVTRTITVAGGNFSQDVILGVGLNNISIVATDNASNTSTAVSTTVTYDNASPEVTVTAPVNNLRTNTGGLLVTGYVNDFSISSVTVTVNGVSQAVAVNSVGGFSKTVALGSGANTIRVTARDAAGNQGTSGVINVNLDITKPRLKLSLSDPTDSVVITVTSNEALVGIPTITGVGGVVLSPIDVNKWSGVLQPVPVGQSTVTASGIDLAGNPGTATGTFIKQDVSIPADTPGTIQTGTTTLVVDTTNDVINQSISITQHTDNPAENTASNEDAGIFLDIVVSGNLSDSIESIYITADYDEDVIFSLGIDEATLKLYLWDEDTGDWSAVPGSASNTTGNYVYGTVDHLSKYGTFGTALGTPPSTPGGGAMGGSRPLTTVSLSGLTSVVNLRVDSDGIVRDACQLVTLDGKTSLDIAKNTKLLDSASKALSVISASVASSPPSPPSEVAIVMAYEFGPDGATFEPAIKLMVSYDPGAVPEGVDEAELYIAYWNGSEWLALESVVDTVNNTVRAEVSHFTQIAVMGAVEVTPPPVVEPPIAPKPAAFTVSSLSISPSEVNVGEMVTISVMVANTGEATGTHIVTLELNGVAAETREVTVNGGASQKVTFTTARDTAGSYTVSIAALSGKFTVKELPVEKPPAEGIGWWVWLIIAIVVVAVVAAVVWRVFIRRIA